MCHFQRWHETQYSFNEGKLGEVDEADWKQLRSQPRGTLQSFPKFLVFFFFVGGGSKILCHFFPLRFNLSSAEPVSDLQVRRKSHFQSALLATQRAAAAIRPVQTDEAFGQKLN